MMGKGCNFQNEYPDYDMQTSENILNSTHDGISDKLKKKIKQYEEDKLHFLTNSMKDDIFYDGTVYTGCAGLAYYYLTRGLQNKTVDAKMLSTALQYIQDKKLKGKKITFICGDAGPLALAAVISYKLRDKAPQDLPKYKIFVDRLMELGKSADDAPDEILYGKAGYLFALLFVNHHVGKEVVPANFIEKVVSSIVESGKRYAKAVHSASPLLWHWHDKVYLGGAHGVAGILYMLLQARNYVSRDDIHVSIRNTLDWLLEQRFKSKNYLSSLGSTTDRLVQWCHGAPGFVPLCLLAAKVYKKDRYMKIAIECGEVTWERGLLTKGYSLCHGVSGNAYALLQLYQATKEPVYLYRAACFMDWVMSAKPGTEQMHPDRPASLFEGLVGRIQFAHDMLNVRDAKFPAMSIEPFSQ